MNSLFVAFAMYSKLPVPRADWTKEHMAWALCWFPLVGGVIGLLLAVWLRLAVLLSLGPMLRGAVALLLPIAVSGGIHLDGFCDTADALGSHQNRERKLEILKDSHVGAFALIACALYLLVFFSAWCEITPTGQAIPVLALIPVLSRCLSGLGAVTIPNARGSGLLATFTGAMNLFRARLILGLLTVLAAAAMVCWAPVMGGAAVSASALILLYYSVMSRRQFGGITGDLAGFFLQLCELAAVFSVAVTQAAGG
ncbi:MAG: adenosylcobinamide-GDP ribazoletransferase [Oscillospiraceae bacterium]|nr:adenosylcobinamide-GDP ribazoletransferase [Oscillospiraceae bacterium]